VCLFQAIAKTGQPASALREPIFQIAGETASEEVRRAAVRVLCCGCSLDEIDRLAHAAGGDSSSYQSILQRAKLPPEGLERFGGWLLDHGVFRADQFGMKDIARADRMPADFVPRHWPTVNDGARKQLCGFAEFQLSEYGDEGLHRFLVGVAFSPGPVEVRATVFNALYRWYYWKDTSRQSAPIAIRQHSIERFFGSVPTFLSTYTRFLKDPNLRELLSAANLADPLTGMLRNADPDVLPALVEQPRAVFALADVVAEIAYDERFGIGPRNECIGFLAWLGQRPEFHKKMRARVVAFKGTDLDYACSRALERLNATPATA
jgi:hypothetical protein